MATRYWVGGTGTWDNTSTANWSATSGGASGASAPTSADDVIFNASSGSGTVTINVAGGVSVKSLDASQSSIATITGSSGTGAVTCAGSFILKSSGLTWSANDTITLTGTGTFSPYSCIGAGSLTINGTGITVTLGSDFIAASTPITLTAGTFDASTYNVTIPTFNGNNSNTRTLTMGSGTWTLRSTGTVWNLATTTNLTFNKGSANINLFDSTTASKTFAGGGLTYNGLAITSTTGIATYIITGSNTFSSISSLKTVAYTLSLTAGTTTTVTSFTCNGSAGNIFTLNSATAGTVATLAGTSGTVNYATITDVNLSSANTLIAANSTVINASNWTIASTSKRWTVLTTGTSWTAPSDWSSTGNELHVLGAGGGGAGNVPNTIAGGAGGGGGGYAGLTNLSITPSTSYSYTIGSGGTAGTGSTTSSQAGTGGTSLIKIGSTTYTAVGGAGGYSATGPTSTGGKGGNGPIGFVSSAVSVQNTASTTISVSVPTVFDGNLLIMTVNSNGATATWTTPSGWTLGTAGANGRAVFYRTASSEPASYTLTQSGSNRADAAILAYSNAAWDTSGLANQTSAGTISPVAITVGTTNSTIVYVVVSTGTASVTYTTPIGYTTRASDSDASDPSFSIFDIYGIPSGSYTGPSTTASSGACRAYTIALSPVAQSGVTSYVGGSGGAGATSGVSQRQGGGGGGAAGPNGNGGNGAAGAGGTGSASGGGGGNGGGTNASGITGGTGYGSGLGGAGGSGTTSPTGTGGVGTDGLEIVLNYYGSGGGAAGSGRTTNPPAAGLYGAGAGGTGTFDGTARAGGTGAQGVIIIGYTGTYTISTGNFLTFF